VSSPAADAARTGAVGCVVQLASISSVLNAASLRTIDGIAFFILVWMGGFYSEILGNIPRTGHIPAGQRLVNTPHSTPYLQGH
jgi:hypothetical protein